MSWSTFRERWQLFVGGVVAVALGVALVQASLLTLLAAADPVIPADLSAHDELLARAAYNGAVSLSAIIMAVTTFVAVFVVGSTFAFTVAQRRRDLALLRLTGATPRQVRRLLRGEALLLGAIGTLLGIGLGIMLSTLVARMYVHYDFVPVGFSAPWHPWVVAVSAVVGLGIAVLGSSAASRRAGKVRALDALRSTGTADRVMTAGRWLAGLLAAVIASAFVISAASSRGAAAMDYAVPACLFWVVAFSALSPVVVPLIGTVIDRLSRLVAPSSRLSELVNANLRDGIRRTSSTAAPVILLVGLVVGLAGTVQVIDAGRSTELTQTVDGDLVVVASAPVGEELAALTGVGGYSEEASVLVELQHTDVDLGVTYESTDALAVDAATYPLVHAIPGGPSSLVGLVGESVALDRNLASTLHVAAGDQLPARLAGVVRDLRVVAVLPETMTGPDVMLPLDIASGADGEWRYIVQANSPEQAAAVRQQIETTWPGAAGAPEVTVSGLQDWIGAELAARRQVSQNVILAILGLATLYIAIAVVNSVVIAAADRREEFAVVRLAGMTRSQVVRAALWESLAVTAIGVILGGAAAAVTLVGVANGVSDVVGSRVLAVPWFLIGATILGAVLVVGITSVLTATAITRQPAITVAGQRE